MSVVLNKSSDFGHFFNLLISKMDVNYDSQNGFLRCSFALLNHFWKFKVSKYFIKIWKFFMTVVLRQTFRLWPFQQPSHIKDEN